jgi:diacylglycerol kinase family enzyme
VPIFVNTRAGAGVDVSDIVAGHFDRDAITLVRTDPARLAVEVSNAVAAGTPVIGIAGGDGSMRTAAESLVGTGTALLPVPTGTLNHFARRCGIADIAAAGAALRAQVFDTLPVGMAGNAIFLNTLTLGEYARTVRIRERLRRFVGKWPAALVGFNAALLSMRRFGVAMETEGHSFTRRTPFVWIGIGWGSFPRVHEALERRSRPDLEVAVLRSGSRRAGFAFLLRLGWRMIRGEQPVRDPALEVLHARDLTLTASRTIDGTADGEVMRLLPPLAVTVRDDALRVVVGAAAAGSASMAKPT